MSAVLTLLFLALPTINNLQYDGSVAAGHGQRGGGGMVSATPASTQEKPSVNKNPYSILNRAAAAYSGQSTPHTSSGSTKLNQKPAAESKTVQLHKRSTSKAEGQESQRQKRSRLGLITLVPFSPMEQLNAGATTKVTSLELRVHRQVQFPSRSQALPMPRLSRQVWKRPVRF